MIQHLSLDMFTSFFKEYLSMLNYEKKIIINASFIHYPGCQTLMLSESLNIHGNILINPVTVLVYKCSWTVAVQWYTVTFPAWVMEKLQERYLILHWCSLTTIFHPQQMPQFTPVCSYSLSVLWSVKYWVTEFSQSFQLRKLLCNHISVQ